ncbi:MAG: formylglycine-generating enzyme family protein, partial [Planctomycetaceae bacterium]|nr:formylglycine-generating enzyme family protein [Planctomycetaceae bacterium]
QKKSKLQIKDNVFTLKYRRRQTVTITRLSEADVTRLRRSGEKVPLVKEQKPITKSPTREETKPKPSPVPVRPAKVTVPIRENADLKFVRWYWANCKGGMYLQLPEKPSPECYITVREAPTFEIRVDAEVAKTMPPRFVKVVGLFFGRNVQITNEFVADLPIEPLEHLEKVVFDGQRLLTGKVYDHLWKKKPNLKDLSDIQRQPEELLPYIQRFQHLEAFAFHGTDGERWAEGLREIKTLRKIHTYVTDMTPKALEQLATLPRLNSLDLDREFYRHSWLDQITKMKELTELSLPEGHGQPFTKDVLLRFSALKKLTHLDLGGEAPREAVLALQRTLPNCTITFRDEGVPASIPPAIAWSGMSFSEAKKVQRHWAEFLGSPAQKTVQLPGGATMDFVLIPPGRFLMGLSDQDRKSLNVPSVATQRWVQISQPFYLGKTEMTLAQWESITGRVPTETSNHPGDSQVMPVVNMSWNQSQKMLKTLNKSRPVAALRISLPTEAQWEYACRAGTKTPFSFGNLEDFDDNSFWHSSNANRKIQPVGTSKPNAWGLFDLHGNIQEWVEDSAKDHDPDWHLQIGSQSLVDGLEARIFRGGSVWDEPSACRSAFRGRYPADDAFPSLGLRLAMPASSQRILLPSTD